MSAVGSKRKSIRTVIFRKDNQQGPAVEHRELCSMLCGSLDGRGVWGRMDTRICMAESLCCPPETITTLLICYIPIQNLKKDLKELTKEIFIVIAFTFRSMIHFELIF